MDQNAPRVLLTADVGLTINKEKILLIKRAKWPELGKWVFPGGHIDFDDPTVAHGAARELFEEVGIAIDPKDLEFVCMLDGQNRDPRPDRYVTIYYTIDFPNDDIVKTAQAGSDAKSFALHDLKDVKKEDMGFDHFLAIEKLREKFGVKV